MAVMSREGTKATTLDYPSGYTRQVLCADAISGPDGGGTAAPTEAQLTILHDNGMVKDLPPAATWVHASLLIDDVFRNSAGAQAREWLVESGAAHEQAHQAVDLARRDIVASKGTSLIYKDPGGTLGRGVSALSRRRASPR